MNVELIKNVASLVEKVAPTLANSLLGGVPAIVLQLLQSIFGVNSDGLASAISSDPTGSEKLEKLELQFKNLIVEHQTQAQMYQSEVDDRKSAREREIDFEKTTGKRDWVMESISIVFMVFFFIVCILNFFLKIKDDALMTILMGQISAGAGLILAYYFGSSKN